MSGKPYDDNYAHSAFYKNTGIGSVPLLGELGGTNDPFRFWNSDITNPDPVEEYFDSYTPDSIAFHDVDGDGDFDMISRGQLQPDAKSAVIYHKNTGSATSPSFVRQYCSTLNTACADNPFHLILLTTALAGANPEYHDQVTFVNLYGNSQPDVVVAGWDKLLFFPYQTGGSDTNNWKAGSHSGTGTTNPFNGFNNLGSSERVKMTPAFADIDGDGMIDMVLATYFSNSGRLVYFRNTGTSDSPTFTPGTPTQTLATASLGPYVALQYFKPLFTDVDGDGDLDLVMARTTFTSDGVSNDGAGIWYIRNTGKPELAASTWLEPANYNPSMLRPQLSDNDPFFGIASKIGSIICMANADSNTNTNPDLVPKTKPNSSPKPKPNSLGSATCIATADLDGDGAKDFVICKPRQTTTTEAVPPKMIKNFARPSYCHFNGEFTVDSEGSGTCGCLAGFSGTQCKQPCPGLNGYPNLNANDNPNAHLDSNLLSNHRRRGDMLRSWCVLCCRGMRWSLPLRHRLRRY